MYRIDDLFTAIYEDNFEQARIILNDPDFAHISKSTLTLNELDEICIQCRILEGISSEFISPLHYAAMKNSYIAILLIDYYNRIDGNNNYALNDRNENGKTALHYASYYDQILVEFVLLERGADINSTDNAGNTPMHIAAANNNMNSIMFLLSDIGADITIQNNYGETARNLAAEYEEGQDIVDLLDYMSMPFAGDVYGIEH